MSSSTGSGDVVDECAWWAAEAVVEADRGGECEEARSDAGSEAVEGAGAVAFEGEQVFAGLEDRFDPLADRREVRAAGRVRLCGGAGRSWRRVRRRAVRTRGRRSLCRRSRTGARCAGSVASRVRQTSRSGVLGEVSSERARGAVRARTGRAGGSPRSSGCGWRSSRSRPRRRAGCAGSSRRCGRTRPGSSRPAPGRRGSRGCRSRTRPISASIVSLSRSPALQVAGPVRAAAGTGARAACARP